MKKLIKFKSFWMQRGTLGFIQSISVFTFLAVLVIFLVSKYVLVATWETLSNFTKTEWIESVTVIATFFAVFVALFHGWLDRKVNNAELSMEINLKPPDSVMIISPPTYQDPQTKQTLQTPQDLLRILYVRIKVEHKSGPTGENAEIIPTTFYISNVGEGFQVLKKFLPISLEWSYLKNHLTKVPVNLYRFCDLGYFKKHSRINNKAVFVVATVHKSLPVDNGEYPNILEPGRYRFILRLSGDNVAMSEKTWELQFDDWDDNQDKMLKKISITPTN